MMHKVTVRIVNVAKSSRFGLSKLSMGRTTGRGFGKRPRPTRGSVPMAGCVPARAVLALLLWVANERAVCVPTWVVLTCARLKSM